MSIISTELGTNSIQFDYSSNTTLAEISASINAEIINEHGWEVHDANAGTWKICYKAQNLDTLSHKYVIVDLSEAESIKLQVYQNWDAVTHSGTNLCYNSDNKDFSGKIYTDAPGQIYLYISPQWLAMNTRNPLNGSLNYKDTAQGVFGCFEFSRDNVEDVDPNLPCFMWTNSSLFYINNGCGYTPKFLNEDVGTDAKIEVSTIMGKTSGTLKVGSFTPSSKNPWNNKDWAFTIYVHEPNFCVRGRVYGLKIATHAAYLFLDRIISKCDENFLYSSTGTDIEHHIIHSSTSDTLATSQEGRVIIPV